MDLPSEDLIHAVISDIDNDNCDKKSGHKCETCQFSEGLGDRSTEDRPAAIDQYILETIERVAVHSPRFAMALLVAGPDLVGAFRAAMYQATVLGYKICKSQEDNKKLSGLLE